MNESDTPPVAALLPASAARQDLLSIHARMMLFATTKPSPQQTRQKSAREIVELFAQELAAALRGIAAPPQPKAE